jgi:hypothetical protein
VGAAISFGVRQSALGDLSKCAPSSYTNCDPSLAPTVSRGQTANVLVNVLGVVGGVGVAGGVVLLVTGTGPTKQARLVVTPTLGGAEAAWRF